MRVVTAHEMRELDREAIEEYGIPENILMENAGLRASMVVAEKYQGLQFPGEIAVIAGKGNNGGDAFVVARHLISEGYPVRVFVLSGIEYKGESLANLEILKRQEVRVNSLEDAAVLESFFLASQDPVLIIDGLIGTGLRDGLTGIYADIIDVINEHSAFTISLDIPSGVRGDTGSVSGKAIRANMTISMGFPKIGLFIYPGAELVGELSVVDISLPPRMKEEGEMRLIAPQDILPQFRHRDRFAHKNQFGHCLLIGGSHGKAGAIVLASKGCLHSGVGLVTVATWEESYSTVSHRIPDEAMSISLSLDPKKYSSYESRMGYFNSVVVGPGLGTSPEAKKLVTDLIERYQGPLVIDADGINVLSNHDVDETLARRKAPTVLTPHPGELSRYLGWEKERLTSDPVGALKEAVERTNCVVVLKGATTLINGPDSPLWLNHAPNAGMAKGGSGDVLAGILGGILAQKYSGLEASKLGVFTHSLAGKHAALDLGHRSMTAGSISDYLPNAFEELKELRAKWED